MSTRLPYIPTILAITCVLSACGPKNDKKDPSDEILPEKTVLEGNVRLLSAEDPNCMTSGTTVATLPSATIYEWDGLKINSKVVSLTGQRTEETDFASAHILGAVTNYEVEYNCKLSASGEKECDKGSKAKQDLQWLRICRTDGKYQRHALETMALASFYYTETAYTFYNSITGSLSGIANSILIPQPKISYEITKKDGQIKKKIDADNASFQELAKTEKSPSLGVFKIYPTSQDYFTTNKHNLWEVPYVMRHEFGHHVFNHYVKDTAEANGISLSGHTGLDSILPVADRKHRPSLSLVDNTKIAQWALDGINETFADLYAYFAGNSAKDQLKGVECLDTSRDPSRPLTRAGQPKGLNKARIDIYEGRASAPASNGDCYEPTFDDEHDIATALGQPLARFIENTRLTGQGKDRAQILLIWAARMQQLVAQSRSSITTDLLVRELILSVKSITSDTSAACRELKPQISGLTLSTQACGG